MLVCGLLSWQTASAQSYIRYINPEDLGSDFVLAGIEFNLKDYDINYEIISKTQNMGKYIYAGLINIEK